MSLRRHFLEHLKSRLGAAASLRVRFWDGDSFDFSPVPTVTLTLGSRKLLRLFAAGDMARLGEAYVQGDLGVEGKTDDILRVGLVIAERVGRSRLLRQLGHVFAHLPRHSKARDAANVRFHYDVSTDFYRLWLDRHLVYSCAYFETGREALDEAQERKLDHLCRKLRLKPGERLLDIGCGWGGLICWAAERYGVEAVGVTLSPPQAEETRRRAAALGLDDRVEVLCHDYRDIAGAGVFDKIVSVGMYEHVGIRNLPVYFGTTARLLRPGGLLLNHGITTGDRDGQAQGPHGGEFIDRFVFPGGELPHVSRVFYEIAGAQLEPIDWEDLRPHYPLTLRAWVTRLEANREAAIAAAGAPAYRVWRMYMAGMAYAFERGWLSVGQLLAVKPLADRPGERPWNRRYQYPPEIRQPLPGASETQPAAMSPPC